MLAWKKAAIESDGTVDVLVGEMRPQGIFLLLDLAVAGNLSEAYFEDGFEGLRGQLDRQYTAGSGNKLPNSQ